MDKTLKLIIEQLSEKTKAGQVNWQTGNNSNEYILFLPDASISISLFSSFDNRFVDCTVSNNRGDIVLRENTSQNTDDGRFLVDFYNLVRDAYTGKDNVISSIFSQLSSDKPIGALPSPDDEIPF